MINDSGTYFIKRLDIAEPLPSEHGDLGRAARRAKVRVLDHRLDVADGNRDFPAYLDSNRLLSNLPATTIFFPVVDLSHQYIDGHMYC